MKSIILCADDYGQTPPISQAIIQLLKQKRLSATSCLVTSPFWRAHAEWLKNPEIHADIGLHFNLTEGKPLTLAMQGFPSLSMLLIKACLRKLNFNDILTELNAQIDEFEAGLGRLPDYIDGHQHVQQLPIIRDAILKVYEQRLKPLPGSYIRCINDSAAWARFTSDAYIKRNIIQLCGGSAFKKQLLRRKVPHNSSFAGIYNFKNSSSYAQVFLTFLKQISDNGLIMCHPGLETEENEKDAIYYSRHDEYQYFLSAEFLEACRLHQVILKTFRS